MPAENALAGPGKSAGPSSTALKNSSAAPKLRKLGYVYDFWRPVTAIGAADSDGNDATVPEATWETHLNTPPIPDYPSTHSVAGGAASVVLARFFGKDEVAFSMTSGPPFAGIARSFKSFSQASQENADSRVYAGLHFRSACQDGIKLGQQIGRRAFAQYLQAYRE
jgi:hypothetical protein